MSRSKDTNVLVQNNSLSSPFEITMMPPQKQRGRPRKITNSNSLDYKNLAIDKKGAGEFSGTSTTRTPASKSACPTAMRSARPCNWGAPSRSPATCFRSPSASTRSHGWARARARRTCCR